jgi:hypothetical protein
LSASPNAPYAAPSRSYSRCAGSHAARAPATSPRSIAPRSASTSDTSLGNSPATHFWYASVGPIRSCCVTGTTAGPPPPGPDTRTTGPITASASSGRHENWYEPAPSRTTIGDDVPAANPSTSPSTAPVAALLRYTSADDAEVFLISNTCRPVRGDVHPWPHAPGDTCTVVEGSPGYSTATPAAGGRPAAKAAAVAPPPTRTSPTATRARPLDNLTTMRPHDGRRSDGPMVGAPQQPLEPADLEAHRSFPGFQPSATPRETRHPDTTRLTRADANHANRAPGTMPV